MQKGETIVQTDNKFTNIEDNGGSGAVSHGSGSGAYGFVNSSENYANEEITFNHEITELHICVDTVAANSIDRDFVGFKFREINGNLVTLSPDCGEWNIIDLTHKRLIGFNVIVSDYTTGRRNIRAIAPIVDTYPCTTTEITYPISDMIAYI